MTKSIRIFYAFARSGGTLLNQLLGVHRDCLVLSEVNPSASYKSIADQAIEWLQLLDKAEREWFNDLSYPDKIAVLSDRAEAAGKTLIIRDWPTVNFLPMTAGLAAHATRLVEQRLYLQRQEWTLIETAITRRSYGIYKSMVNNFSQFAGLSEDKFAEAYVRYAEEISRCKIYHMEDLQQKPATTIADILSSMQVPTQDPFELVNKFSSFQNCTGNNTLKDINLRVSDKIIKPRDPPSVEGGNDLMREADRMLGYE